jgi:hypothetical protein
MIIVNAQFPLLCYSSDFVSFERLQDLTGLAEGEVHALRKF